MSKLSDRTIKAFVNRGEPNSKLFDGGGLHIFITPAGSPTWRIKYRDPSGKEKTYSAGVYPTVSLAAARVQLTEVKSLLKAGRDPVIAKNLNKAAQANSDAITFAMVADAWLLLKKPMWSAVHFVKSQRALQRDVYPALGALPVAAITPAMVSVCFEKIASRGAHETAARILQHVQGVFRFAQGKGYRTDNPATPVSESLPRATTTLRPAIVDPVELREILRRAELSNLSASVRMAHRLCAFTTARISNVVEAEWSQFDLDGGIWTIPRAKLKVASRLHDLRIPLHGSFLSELRAWKVLVGRGTFVFPSPQGNKHIGREALEKAYRVTLGLRDRHSPHSWRAAFSTLARDHGFERELVELTLDHIHDNQVALAYDRGERFRQRQQLMKWWTELLFAT